MHILPSYPLLHSVVRSTETFHTMSLCTPNSHRLILGSGLLIKNSYSYNLIFSEFKSQPVSMQYFYFFIYFLLLCRNYFRTLQCIETKKVSTFDWLIPQLQKIWINSQSIFSNIKTFSWDKTCLKLDITLTEIKFRLSCYQKVVQCIWLVFTWLSFVPEYI